MDEFSKRISSFLVSVVEGADMVCSLRATQEGHRIPPNA